MRRADTPPQSAQSPHSDNFAEATTTLSRVAPWLLRGPLAALLCGLALMQVASWLPHYLTWPYWADHDVYATLALGWHHGVLPYRDLACNNFPGTIYLFWALGRVAGWGRTLPFYAFDAGLVLAFGFAVVGWSRRRLGESLPGLVAYVVFLSDYLSFDYTRAGQHDWHATFFAVTGVLALQCWSTRAARLMSAGALALAVITRPQAVLFLPAVALALDERARESGEPLRRSLRACVEWGAAFLAGVALGFVPLAAAGVLPDFVHGVSLASYGSSYSQVTPRSIVSAWLTQMAPLRMVAVPAMLLLFRRWGDPPWRRMALTWGVGFAAVSLYRPLSPHPHAYLDIPLFVVWTMNLAILTRLVLGAAGVPAALRLSFVLLFLGLGATARPIFCAVSRSTRAVTALRHRALPDGVPLGYRRSSVPTGAYYAWDDYHSVVEYLKHKTRPETRVANALKGDSALTGATARLPAFPAESVTWLRMVNRADEARFARALSEARESVVVWVPGEPGPPDGPPLDQITTVIERLYEPEAKFGAIEVWRRKADETRAASR